VLVLAPAGFPARWSGLILLAPLFLVAPARPPPGSAWLTLLDVGQGLAAIVRTRHHVLVYDTGPRYSEGFDTGMAVVVPYLRHLGIHRVDTMMISHGDNDHIGGAQSVLRLIETGSILSGAPDRLSRAGAEPCVAGQAWRWDGVGFRVLHPRSGLDPQGNNASCVLRIEAADGASMLLTGDIESGVEQALLAESPDALKATVLVVPHHGSLTSSTAGFVAAVEPDYALFAAGYRNRYGLPHQRVIRRYRRRGARVLDTARHGAITVRLGDGGGAADVSLYRPSHLRYWNHPG
jgi:competence protein ComEC